MNVKTRTEVIFAVSSSALTDVIRKLPLSIDGDLLTFVHSEAINVEHRDLHAREMLDTRANRRFPFAKPILH